MFFINTFSSIILYVIVKSSWKQELIWYIFTDDFHPPGVLRILSLTNFFSKEFEKFFYEWLWLMSYIGEMLDPKQFGGLKGTPL